MKIKYLLVLVGTTLSFSGQNLLADSTSALAIINLVYPFQREVTTSWRLEV